MGRSNLIVGTCSLHNVVMAYGNVVNTTTNFVEPTQPTNMITN